MSIRVLLVDDHAVVREGYRGLLQRTPDIEVVAQSASAEDAYRVFCGTPCDVLVLDINLPGTSGIELTARILAREPRARVLVFSMHDDVMFVSRALQAGARGYLTKASAPEVLVEAVRAVAAGKVYLSQDVAQQLALQTIPGQQLPLGSLSPREFEVFRQLAEGRTVAEIAATMCLSQKTIANYQSNIRQKLELTNAAQIVRLAMSYGLVDPGAG
jgi:DNA-binding NarL/FixJ family response regulator